MPEEAKTATKSLLGGDASEAFTRWLHRRYTPAKQSSAGHTVKHYIFAAC